jgi:hypothetical protein
MLLTIATYLDIIMTNAWSFLHDELYGESKMSESLGEDNYEFLLKDYENVVGASGEDRITFKDYENVVGASDEDRIAFKGNNTFKDDNTFNLKFPKSYETFDNNNGRWKYHEDIILNDIKDYVAGTYRSHYTGKANGNVDIQTIDLLATKGLSSGFCQSNIIKYGTRYGDKDGKNKKDLLKVIHYAMLLLYFDGHYKVIKSDFPY